MSQIKTIAVNEWDCSLNHSTLQEVISELESGQVIYLPKLCFPISAEEKVLFSSNLVNKDRKNISHNPKTGLTKGAFGDKKTQKQVHEMMQRFCTYAQKLIHSILPSYEEHLTLGRTSFRPVEIEGRKNASFRKDDTLLHLDSFPSSPTGGKRILRFFANVNPFDKPRVWKVGESYEKVLKRYIPKIKSPLPGSRFLLNRLGITKSYRILYDHYMLNIHNSMKADEQYQKEVDQEIVEFPPFTCWLCFTDQVSHAALAGQYVFEQSFYLPIEAQKHPEQSPLHYMEKIFNKRMRN